MPKKSARAQWAAQIRDGSLTRKSVTVQPVSVSGKPYVGKVLGIDPSLRGTGLAVLEFMNNGSVRFRTSVTIKPERTANLPECLGTIARAVDCLIEQEQPDSVAIEETIYVQNFQTAQKLGAARGAAIGEAARRHLPVHEYPPLRIKQAVVGYGRASKEQVSRQISVLLSLEKDLPFDEADAAAVAMCHAFTHCRTVKIGVIP